MIECVKTATLDKVFKLMIFTFTNIQNSFKRIGMKDVIYFEGILSVHKDTSERYPLSQDKL